MEGPGGIAQQTAYAINQPGCPTRQVTRTIIIRPASGRPNDPNLPPSYDQAMSGADRSIKVDGQEEPLERNPLLQPPPRINSRSDPLPPSAPPANLSLPHMPPPRNPQSHPPAYEPTPSAPRLSDDFDDQSRPCMRRLFFCNKHNILPQTSDYRL